MFLKLPRPDRSPQDLEILEHEEQVIGVGWAGFELPGFLPLTRGILLGVNQQAVDAGDVGGLLGAQ